MDDVINTASSQNQMIVTIGNKLKTLKGAIRTSRQTSESTISEFKPIVGKINEKLDTIRNMLDEAKRIKLNMKETTGQRDALVKEKEATVEALSKKDNEIEQLKSEVGKKEALAAQSLTEYNNRMTMVQAANAANLKAKEKTAADLEALQRQSNDTSSRYEKELKGALDQKAAAEEMQKRINEEKEQLKAALDQSRTHARDLQSSVSKVEKLKEQQAQLTAALNALDGEITAANDDITALDKGHVEHLQAIKDQLSRLDEELRNIISSDPSQRPKLPPAAGAGDVSNEERNVKPSEQIPILNTRDGTVVDRNEQSNLLGNIRPYPPRTNRLSAEDASLIQQGLAGDNARHGPTPFERSMPGQRRGGTRRKQRGGYIAIRKTRSNSSSSSGRRRRRSSSSSTRRKRHYKSTRSR